MSRAFIAFYMGDYQKKTQHLDTLQHGAYFLLLQHCWTHGALPAEPAGRAAIARMSLPAWKKIAPVVNVFFDDDGRNKRASEEVEKAERVSLQRAMAGRKGGFKSGVSKSIAKGKQLLGDNVANATRSIRQPVQQKAGISEAIQNLKTTSSLSGTARESVDENQQTGVALATAHLDGALRETPTDSASPLVESLQRLETARTIGHPPGRPCWVSEGTDEWNAHQHWRRSRAWKPLVAFVRTIDGVELTGQWCESMVPPGYDEATGEKLATGSEENAA